MRSFYFFSAEEIILCVIFCRGWKCWNDLAIAVLLFFPLCTGGMWLCGVWTGAMRPGGTWSGAWYLTLLRYHQPGLTPYSPSYRILPVPDHQVISTISAIPLHRSRLPKLSFIASFTDSFWSQCFQKLLLIWGIQCKVWQTPLLAVKRWNRGAGHYVQIQSTIYIDAISLPTNYCFL